MGLKKSTGATQRLGLVRNRANLLLPAAHVPGHWLCVPRWRCYTPTQRAPGAALPQSRSISCFPTLHWALHHASGNCALGSLPVACKVWLVQQARADCHLSLAFSPLLLLSYAMLHPAHGGWAKRLKSTEKCQTSGEPFSCRILGSLESHRRLKHLMILITFATFGKASNFCLSACAPASEARLVSYRLCSPTQ